MKIVICTDGIFPYSIGGMQRHSRLLIEELMRKPGLQIVVLHPHLSSVFESDKVEEIFIKPIDVKRNYLMECYEYSKRVYDCIMKRPDHIVYSQGLSIWYKIHSIPNKIIINPHGLEAYQAIGFRNKLVAIPFKIIFNYLFKYATAIVSLGGKLTKIIESHVRDVQKIVNIPNGVNFYNYSPRKYSAGLPLKILFVARFANNKGIDILFKSISLLNRQGFGADFHFYLAGGGPLFSHYSTVNKFANVHLLGRISDEEMKDLYKTSDLFVLPTLYEGMPTVVLEAMSYGLPVIVSDVGATACLITFANGKLIRPGSVKELTQSLIWFKDLPLNKRIDMGNNSIAKVLSSFTWKSVGDLHFKLFAQLQNEQQIYGLNLLSE